LSAALVGATVDFSRPVGDFVDRVQYFLEVSGMSPGRADVAIRDRYGDVDAIGWEIVLDTPKGPRPLDVVLGLDYPFTPAKIGAKRLAAEDWPDGHMAGGYLCLFSSADVRQVAPDERELLRALQRAAELLGRPPGEDEFREEFINYWNRQTAKSSIWSLLTPETPYGCIVAHSLSDFTLVSPDRGIADLWLARRYGGKLGEIPFRNAYYLSGAGLPHRLRDASVIRTFAEADRVLKDGLVRIAREGSSRLPVVFRLPGEFALVGGFAKPPALTRGMVKKAVYPGFRAGKEPPNMLLDYRFGAKSIFEHAPVHRVDAEWVLYRGGEEFDEQLFQSHVCLVGIGSLGSSIARALVKAGVGRLTLIDGDVLTWGNVARHEIGSLYVDCYKAKSMADTLSRDFPFADIRAVNRRWQRAVRHDPSALQADVVLSTMGSWADEWQLNLAIRDMNVTGTLIFGWVEEHAAAAQVLVVAQNGGCLGCGMTAAGAFSHAATSWETPQSRSEPSCSTMYGPYADLAAARARILISTEVLRVLKDKPPESYLVTEVADRIILEKRGGKLSGTIAADARMLPDGVPYVSKKPWPKCGACAGCLSAA
jgi:sulfur-carrier protein adenylyltransferase/sulfurtransferase